MSGIRMSGTSSKSQFKAAMQGQAPQWTEFLSCPICYNVFGETHNRPISLGCGHTICKVCLGKIEQKKCPFDQIIISHEIDELPVNFALLQLVGVAIPESADANRATDSLAENYKFYTSAKGCIEDLAIHLKPVFQASGGQAAGSSTPALSRPMQRKLVTLVNCQLLEDEGRARALRAARSLGERTVTELILQHQNPQQLSANLWAAVRARGCQFLGPAMQEEVLKLVLLALEDGSALSRKVLVLFAVQRLESQYTQASKTAVGHVVQLLYRASCFKVTKREEESSLMQLKDEFRTYEALRREHDSQIVQIATEAGLRISPEQWSSLLYGDAAHKSYMQSIIDKLQTPQSFFLSVSELMLALQRTNDPGNLARLKPHFDLLANIDPSPDSPPPSWENLEAVMRSVLTVVEGLIEFVQARSSGKTDPIAHHNTKFKTSMCRDLLQKGRCPRGTTCTFAHSQEEMERFRNQTKKFGMKKVKGLLGGLSPGPSDLGGPLAGSGDDMSDFVTFTHLSSHPGLGLIRDDSPSPPALQISRSTTIVPATQQSVSVPVGKPSIMPVQAKKTIGQQTIYTSPTHAREDFFSPRPVAMSQRAPPPHIVYKGRPGVNPTHTPRTISVTSKITPTQVTPSVNPMLCLPPNPYTASTANGRVNIPTTDSHYYLTSNIAASTRGKSPSQQLEELHRRKTELITQLNESCPSPATKETSTPSPPKPPPPSAPPRSNQPKQNVERTPISKNVADSMATTLTTMAVLRVEQEVVENDGGSKVSESEYPAGQRTMYNSFVDRDPVVYKAATIKTLCQTQVSSSPPEVTASRSMHPDYQAAGAASAKPTSRFLSAEEEGIFQEMMRSNYRVWLSEEEDEFIPFEHTVVSKFGPISRSARIKAKDTHPLQVQAAQAKDTTPTAVTPLQRPYPVSYQVPSRFDPETGVMKQMMNGTKPDPQGLYVATSLPTALMQPNVVTAGATVKPNTLLRLRQKVLNLPGIVEPIAQNDREKIRSELSQLNDKIENLKISEDERLARELQAVELNIQETQRQLKLDEKSMPSEVAKAEQAKAVAKVEEKRVQEVLDRRLAEILVLEEARQLYG